MFLIQDTKCSREWLTQICDIPYGVGEHTLLFPERRPVHRADGLSCGTLAYALFCFWWPCSVPTWVTAAAVVNLCHTLPSSFPQYPTVFPSKTYTQANKLLVSWDNHRHLWIQSATGNIWLSSTGTPLRGFNWYSNTKDPLTSVFSTTVWALLIKNMYDNLFLHIFIFQSYYYCLLIYFLTKDDMVLVFASFESQGQLKDSFGSVETHKNSICLCM